LSKSNSVLYIFIVLIQIYITRRDTLLQSIPSVNM
jgi:hypothetical protein